MAIQEVVIRPGDSISLVLDVPGHPMRLDLSLTRNGVAVSGPVPMGTPTIYGGVTPRSVQQASHQSEVPEDVEMVDLTEEFEAEDRASDAALPPQRVESLAAVEPFGDPQAVDIPFEDISDDSGGYTEQDNGGYAAQDSYEEPATVEESSSADLDLDLSDLGDDIVEEEVVSVDVPEDDGPALDLSLDGESEDEPGFSADAMTMLPPTRKTAPAAALSLEEEVEMDESGNPKEKFRPGPEDTLPVWTGKATSYKDPNIEHKKATAKVNKSGKPATAAVGAKPAPTAAKPAPKLPPGKQPVKKPATGSVSPAASGRKPAAAEGNGNFTVFLSPPKGSDKKQAAAEIIADLQGIDMNSALALAGKMIVPVVKGVTEDEANTVRDRFKDAGLSCRITQKR